MALGRDGIAGLILLGIGLALLIQSFGLPQVALVPVGPGFYPRIVLSFLAAAGAALIVLDWRARRARAAKATAQPRKAYGLVVAAFVIVGGYCFLLPILGFRLATPLFVAGLQATLEWPHDARQWALLAAVALGTAAVTYFAFESYLLVLLPRGSLTGW
ncbi:MAG: tripartite tricarboxylate transporter TctB family protein [Rhodospirillales bacterium]